MWEAEIRWIFIPGQPSQKGWKTPFQQQQKNLGLRACNCPSREHKKLK
jgi:hypothetical protein